MEAGPLPPRGGTLGEGQGGAGSFLSLALQTCRRETLDQGEPAGVRYRVRVASDVWGVAPGKKRGVSLEKYQLFFICLSEQVIFIWVFHMFVFVLDLQKSDGTVQPNMYVRKRIIKFSL